MRSDLYKETQDVIERGTFKAVLMKDFPENSNIIPLRFVLTLESTEVGEVKCKLRYVTCGNLMVHTSTTVQASSSRFLFALASFLSLDIWSADVTQAYLQSSSPLMRDVFIRNPVEDFNLGPDEVLQLVKPLYRLSESNNMWNETLGKHLREDLGMRTLKSYLALYTLKKDWELIVINANYDDDILLA